MIQIKDWLWNPWKIIEYASEEGWRAQQPKHKYNNQDEYNNLQFVENNNNNNVSSQKYSCA